MISESRSVIASFPGSCVEPGNEASSVTDTAGVTGNPIRAYTDPGGSDLLAKSIRRINFTSGSDPPLDQFY